MKTPAVGVQLLVGGFNGRSGSDGSYTIDPHFDINDNVSVFAKYDSLTTLDNVAISQTLNMILILIHAANIRQIFRFSKEMTK